MDSLTDLLAGSAFRTPSQDWEASLLALLLAFVLGQTAAWVYIFTHQGLSYSRSFVQSIILLSVIVCFAMIIIGGSLAIAFGLIGALAVIRFRNILKDTRDTAFVFFALVAGMAAGTGHIVPAVLGTAVFSAVCLYLYWSNFGSRFAGNGFVRFRLAADAASIATLQEVLSRYCRGIQLVTQRFHEEGGGELAYRLNLRDPSRTDRMVAELRSMKGVADVSVVMQEEQAEV